MYLWYNCYRVLCLAVIVEKEGWMGKRQKMFSNIIQWQTEFWQLTNHRPWISIGEHLLEGGYSSGLWSACTFICRNMDSLLNIDTFSQKWKTYHFFSSIPWVFIQFSYLNHIRSKITLNTLENLNHMWKYYHWTLFVYIYPEWGL